MSALETLLAWADVSKDRHFVVTKRGANIETRWRVAVFEKPEGETMTGIPGEGFGETVGEAIVMALGKWSEQTATQKIPGRFGPFWYTHPSLVERETGEANG